MSRTGERIAVVSDLHLAGGGSHEPFREDRRFLDTVEQLVQASAGTPLRLVLLGDTFDFPAVTLPGGRVTPATSGEEARRKVERMAAAHPLVVKALGHVVRAGHRLDIVAGNHDMELLFPSVQAFLREALGAGRGTVAVHPWMLYLPGLLYAEHGQQHHDFNRFPELGCSHPGSESPLPVPAGSYLDALTHLRNRHPDASAWRRVAQAGRLGAGLICALVALRRAERRRGEREQLLTSAGLAPLPADVIRRIDRASAATPTSVVRRAAAIGAGRLTGFSAAPREHYMLAAAQRVHRILGSAACAVPFYVFGHTHVAADVVLADGAARYLNPGTWSVLVRKVAGGERRCGVVLIERTADESPTARLNELTRP